MSTMTDDFTAWFEAPEQAELRLSCSKGWAELIWQASRAALCVELPDISAPEKAGPTWIAISAKENYREQCRAAIEAAGVRAKE